MGATPTPPRSEGPRPTPRPPRASAPDRTTRPLSRASETSSDSATSGIRQGITARPGYIPALDGLRAVAVAVVIAYHLGRLDGGFLGVDVFFVISGFLITRLLLAERERTGKIALGSFWLRRFKRLLPALLVVLVAVAVASKLWLPAWRLGGIRLDSLGAMFYVANWRFIFSDQSYFSTGLGPSPLRHTWSLAIEEQFYLVWPLLVVGLAALSRHGIRRKVAVVAGVGAVASGVWMAVGAAHGVDLSRLYFGTGARVFAILAGAWLAAWWDVRDHRLVEPGVLERWDRRWRLAAPVALSVLVVLFVVGVNDQAWFYRGGFQLAAVASVVLVAGLATGAGALAGALALRPLLWAGRRSYGIYLWSWPTQVFAAEYFAIEGLALDAVVVLVAVGAAALSFWLVEEPIRTGQRPTGFPARSGRTIAVRVPAVAWSAVAIVAVLAVVVGSAAGAPSAPDYVSVSDDQALAGALDESTVAEDEALVASASTVVPIDEGEPGPFSGASTFVVDDQLSVDPTIALGRPMRVMVAGDSVGWSLGWEIPRDQTPQAEVSGRALIGCGLMPRRASFIIGSHEPEQYLELCDKAELAELQGLEGDPDVVLLVVGAWEAFDHEMDGTTYEVGTKPFAELLAWRLQERIDRYRAAGVPTVVPLVPCFAPNARRLGTERQDPERIEWINSILRDSAKRNRGWLRLIRPQDQLCDAEGDAILENPDGLALREDGSHFDPPAAVWFWNSWLIGQMGAAFEIDEQPVTPEVTEPDEAIDLGPAPGG